MEVHRLVENLVKWSVRPFAVPISESLVGSFPPPVFVDPPRIWRSTRSALIHPLRLAIVWARPGGQARTRQLIVEIVPVRADFSP